MAGTSANGVMEKASELRNFEVSISSVMNKGEKSVVCGGLKSKM